MFSDPIPIDSKHQRVPFHRVPSQQEKAPPIHGHQTLTSMKKNNTKKRCQQRREDHLKSSLASKHLSVPYLDRLRDASIRGDLQCSIWYAWRLRSCVSHIEEFRAFVKVLFTHDTKNRSALSYAAHSGHAHLVTAYLAFLVIFMVTKEQTRSNGPNFNEATKLSFQMWLRHVVGFPSFFSPRNLDLCVQNTLNQMVKEALLKEKFTWHQILTIAMQALANEPGARWFLNYFSSSAGRTKQITKRKCRKNDLPRLVIDDGFDSFDDEITYSQDYYEEGEQDYYVEAKLDESDDRFTNVDSQGGEHPEPIPESFTQEGTAAIIEAEGDDPLGDYCFPVVQADDTDNLSELSSVADENEWDVVSNTASVISFNDSSSLFLKDSYAQALVKNLKPIQEEKPTQDQVTAKNIFTSRDSKQSCSYVEGDDDNRSCISYEDFVNGVKGARGGSKVRMFKGNAKTTRRCRVRHRGFHVSANCHNKSDH